MPRRKALDPLGKPSPSEVPVEVWFPQKLTQVFEADNPRYVVLYGGRGAGKTKSMAIWLLLRATQDPLRILCCRETMSSMADSSHQMLADCIVDLHLESFFTIERDKISGINGALFRFAGVRHNVSNIKSMANFDLCWIDEADSVSSRSWIELIPSIRDGRVLKKSQFIITFNPRFESDATWKRFVVEPPPDSLVIKINYYNNDKFPDVLRDEMEHLKNTNYEEYMHVWEGEPMKYLVNAVYADEIRAMQNSNRIMNVPYVPETAIETFWDLGVGDLTVCIIAQRIGGEVHIIDCISGQGKSLDYYLQLLETKPYAIDKFWLPHDAVQHQLGSMMSIEEILRAKGRRVAVVPKLTMIDGINAVRGIFPNLFIDERNCDELLAALRSYRWEVNQVFSKLANDVVFKNEPVHDQHSNYADALRYLAIALKQPKKQVLQDTNKYRQSPVAARGSRDSWMGI